MHSPPTAEQRRRRATARAALHGAPVALLFGAVAAAAALAIARAAGAKMLVPVDPADAGSALVPFGLPIALVQTIFPAFAAAIALALLTRASATPLRWFIVVVCAFVALAVGPLVFPRDPTLLRVDAATRHALAAIHAVRAAVIAWVLSRAIRPHQPPSPDAAA